MSAHTRSVYSTVSQLLAGFRDDEELRVNPLVSAHFRADSDMAVVAERIRSLILTSIDRIASVSAPNLQGKAERQRQILLRHDLGGESRRFLCADMGITERQFYRDRRSASEHLAKYLRAALPKKNERAAVTTKMFDVGEVALQAAMHMSAVGATKSAYGRAEAVAQMAGDVQWRILALSLWAQGLADRQEFAEADRVLAGAEALLNGRDAELSLGRAAGLRASFHLRRGLIAWERGAPRQEALVHLRAGIEGFCLSQSHATAGADPMFQVLVRDVMHGSATFTDAGDHDARMAALAEIGRCTDRMTRVPEYLVLEWRSHFSQSQLLLGTDHEAVSRDYLQTMERAEQLGFPLVASEAAQQHGWIAAQRGDIERARSFQSMALAYAEAHDSPHARAVTYAMASLIEQHVGEPSRALELARLGVSQTSAPRSSDGYLDYVLARAQLVCGLAEEALALASRLSSSDTIGDLGRGATLLLMASAAADVGRRHDALSYADEAATRLGTYGDTYLLAQARAMRKRLRAS